MRYNPDNVKKFLFDLKSTSSAIKGVILLSVEGLHIASTLPIDSDNSLLSALSATILAVGKKENTEMNNGEFNHLYINGSNGGVLIFQLSKFEVLVLLAEKDTNLGALLQSVNNYKFEGHTLFHLDDLNDPGI